MNLRNLIEILQEIEENYGDNHDVSIFTELLVRKDGEEMYEVQIEHDITDVSFSKKTGVVIIGQEL